MARSAAEQEIRDAVVARLRRVRPGARIIHELNSAGTGSTRFDVAAVDHAEIIICEIKSEKDELKRAPHQIAAMRDCGHIAIAAIHEKFLVAEKIGNPRVADFMRDGEPHSWRAPKEVKGATLWVYPEAAKLDEPPRDYYGLRRWREPDLADTLQVPLREAALHMLWAEELRELCSKLGVPSAPRATMAENVRALRWIAPGGAITRGICSALRRREFAEADPAKSEE